MYCRKYSTQQSTVKIKVTNYVPQKVTVTNNHELVTHQRIAVFSPVTFGV